ncbi:MAG: hypothetical protein HJJLKODD_02468 [Phycisphaerae bacterium]|nr:hypothetical protein [Phycisphaerae bacterium]
MILHPIPALLASPATAQRLASVPYDVVDTTESRQLAAGNPLSWLHVVRSEIDLPEGTDAYSAAVYQQAADNMRKLEAAGHLVRESSARLYACRMTMGEHVQVGLMGGFSVAEYEQGIIRKHELTRRDKEDDRTRHIVTTRVQTEPVLLTYRDVSVIDQLLAAVVEKPALLMATSETGVKHEIWPISDCAALIESFAGIPVGYIADGHHRSASAWRTYQQLRGENPHHTGREEYNFFLAAIFPASQMRILAYNRVVKELNGLSSVDFWKRVDERFDRLPQAGAVPTAAEQFSIYMEGRWQTLRIKPHLVPRGDAVRRLDCSLLQEQLLAPILGISDPRSDKRIDFVGGIRGTAELEKRVQAGRAVLAISMYPTSMEQLMSVADAGQIMPPKSTWFEPKLRSGLVAHPI